MISIESSFLIGALVMWVSTRIMDGLLRWNTADDLVLFFVPSLVGWLISGLVLLAIMLINGGI